MGANAFQLLQHSGVHYSSKNTMNEIIITLIY